MSIANGTTYYDYPLVQLSDRPTFADYNNAFTDIDAKLHGLITGAETDHQAIGDLQTSLGETNTLLASVKLTADGAKAKSDTNEENITILNTHLGQTDRNVATKLDSVAIAEPYDPDAGTYSVGDIVVYNGQRYKCTTAVAVSEPFDADKWTGEDVQTVIDEINTALSGEVILELAPNSGETKAQILTRLANALASYSQVAKTKFRVVEGNIGSESVNVYDIHRIGTTGNFGMKYITETGGTYDWARTTASGTASTSIEYYYDTTSQQYVVNDVSSTEASKLTVVR